MGVLGADPHGQAVGAYFTSYYFSFPYVLLTAVSVVWGCINFAALASIKKMVRPRIATNTETGRLEILKPFLFKENGKALD